MGAASQRLCLPSARSAAGHLGLIPMGEEDLALGRLLRAFRLHQDTRKVSASVFCCDPGASQNVLLHLLTYLEWKLPHPPQGTLATVTQGFFRCQCKCLLLPILLTVQHAAFALQAASVKPLWGWGRPSVLCCALHEEGGIQLLTPGIARRYPSHSRQHAVRQQGDRSLLPSQAAIRNVACTWERKRERSYIHNHVPLLMKKKKLLLLFGFLCFLVSALGQCQSDKGYV